MSETKTASRPTFRLVGATNLQKFVTPDQINPPAGVIADNAYEPEDEYQRYYAGGANDKGIIEPPYYMRQLDRLTQENNSLSPCIEAMVQNVDGTGFDFTNEGEKLETDTDDAKIKELRDFFAEPWPGESFTSIRKKLRRDIKRTGNGYLEVLRNAQGEVTFMRHVDAKMIRLMKLDDPVPVAQKLMRKGKEVTIKVMTRERRYCQLLNGVTMVYFKDFMSSRDLDKSTGMWAAPNQRLPANKRATELIHFIDLPDAHTPYGVPCWVNQLPSVLGSRDAEEYNLDYFENGGVPPAMVILQGGMLQTETRKALESKLFGKAEKKNRMLVLEVEPSGGSMDHPNQAKVTVERFGAERTQDSMFEKYDDKCEVRVRRAFRLPPIFVGKADDYSFATAYVSYNVAEAQVFAPERSNFDEVMTMKVLPEMGYRGYTMVSKPLTIQDVTMKLQGLELALSTNQVDMADIIYEINEACGTSIKVADIPDVETLLSQLQAAGVDTTSLGDIVRNPLKQNGLINPKDSSNVDGAGLSIPTSRKGATRAGGPPPQSNDKTPGKSTPVKQPNDDRTK